MSEPILELDRISVGYTRGDSVLRDFSLTVQEGSVLGIVGMNGAGKSTLIKVMAGQLLTTSGRCCYAGREITTMRTARRSRNGIVLLPEGHQVIKSLTVRQNLLLATGRSTTRAARTVLDPKADELYELFPILHSRSDQLAGLLSGGEQQMLSLARALLMNPRLLLLDEPSLGLAPLVLDRIYEVLSVLRSAGMSMVVVEQNDSRLRAISDRLVVLNAGRAVVTGSPSELTGAVVHASYFGEHPTIER